MEWKTNVLEFVQILETYIDIWKDRPLTVTLTTLQTWRSDLLSTVYGTLDLKWVLYSRNITPENIRKYIRIPTSKDSRCKISSEKLHADISEALLVHKNLMKIISDGPA